MRASPKAIRYSKVAAEEGLLLLAPSPHLTESSPFAFAALCLQPSAVKAATRTGPKPSSLRQARERWKNQPEDIFSQVAQQVVGPHTGVVFAHRS